MKFVQLIRRFLLVVSLMFWQGGFMFYGGVVVPLGGQILGSETEQGFITQAVTVYLNLAGAVCLFIWAEQLWHDRHRGVTRTEWTLLTLNGAALIALSVIHQNMTQLLDRSSRSVSHPDQFGLNHKMYIGISSLQWMACLLLLTMTLWRWGKSTTTVSASGSAHCSK